MTESTDKRERGLFGRLFLGGNKVRTELRFEGVASSTAVDRQGERLTAEALRKVADGGPVPLKTGHGAHAKVIGLVEEGWVEDGKLYVRGKLDPESGAARVLARDLRLGARRCLSLGGRTLEARTETEKGRAVRRLEAVEVDHVAVCQPREARNEETVVRIV